MQARQNTFNERKEHYKKRLFVACKKLFARPDEGFEGTTILEVTQATRTSHGPAISDRTINKYFGKKPALLKLVFEQGWARINDSVKKTIEGVDGAVNKLLRMVSSTLELFLQDDELGTVLLMERIEVNNELLKCIDLVDLIFKEGQRNGEFRKDINLQALRSAMFGAVEGMLRDKLYTERLNFPANYSEGDIINITKLLFKVASETTC